MFGIRFVKFEPSTYVLRIKNGKVKSQGAGLSFFYYGPTTSLVAVPASSSDMPFIFEEVSSDFQSVTIQGQVTYRISDPQKISQLLNYTLNTKSLSYISEDPDKLSQRILNAVQVATKSKLQGLALTQALRSSEEIVQAIKSNVAADPAIESLGVEILGVSILAVKPNPETAKALEAEAREKILKQSDEAIFQRRNAAVEQERAIKENELNTEIAVEQKNRQISETKMEAQLAVQAKRQELQQKDLAFQINQETKNKDLVDLQSHNDKLKADTKAYSVAALMESFAKTSPEVLQVLSRSGMNAEQLIADAFTGIAQRADKIGQLNISPDLLRELLNPDRPPKSTG